MHTASIGVQGVKRAEGVRGSVRSLGHHSFPLSPRLKLVKGDFDGDGWVLENTYVERRGNGRWWTVPGGVS